MDVKALANSVVQLPIRHALALIELAERAPLFESERLWIEDLKAKITAGLSDQLAAKSVQPQIDGPIES